MATCVWIVMRLGEELFDFVWGVYGLSVWFLSVWTGVTDLTGLLSCEIIDRSSMTLFESFVLGVSTVLSPDGLECCV